MSDRLTRAVALYWARWRVKAWQGNARRRADMRHVAEILELTDRWLRARRPPVVFLPDDLDTSKDAG